MKRVQRTVYIPVHLDNLIEEHLAQLSEEQGIKIPWNQMFNRIIRIYMERTEYANEVNIPAPAAVAEWLYWELGPIIKAGDYKPELKKPLQLWFKRFQKRVENIMFKGEII